MTAATKVKRKISRRPSPKPTRSSSSRKPGSKIPGVGEYHQPSTDLKDYCILLYGGKSMGKTTLASQLSERSLVCMFEDRENLPIRMVDFPSKSVEQLEKGEPDPWTNFKEVVAEALESDDVDYLVVDTIDLCYKACLNHVAHANGYSHPGEANDYGTTWHEVSEEFRRTMESVRKSPTTGLFLISHCTEERMELNTASKEKLKNYTVFSPSCGKQPSEYIRQSCDYVIYYGKHGRHRGLHFRWSDNIFTASGNDNHFLDEDGKLISVLEVPSKNTAGQCLVSAFNNTPISQVLLTVDEEE